MVIIGRNEAENLPACIRSIRDMDYPQDRLEVMYVDTDSTDGSPGVARSLGVTVFEEHSSFPSPGRARNRGWREANHDLVHFVDGDMTVEPSYLRAALRYLGQDRVVCVFGQLQERNARHNPISRVLQYPGQAKQPGYVHAPAAGGTFLKSALEEAGGYNPDLLRGEETEIGYRLSLRGYRILLIEQPMGTHDFGIRGIAGLWMRYRNAGRAFARILQLPDSPSLAAEKRAARRTLIQGLLAVPALLCVLLLGLWRLVLLVPPLLALYVLVRYWQPAEQREVRIGYFMLEYFFKPAIWAGMVQFAVRD
jgi:glycosyltransferase involved in cell wall biosynthesis